MLGPAFWAGLLFGAVCIFLGLVVGVWGSRIFPPDPARGPPPAVLPAEPAQPSSRPAPRPAPRAAPAPVEAATAAPTDPAADTAILELKLVQAEAARKGAADTAAAALAVAALTQAAEGSQPFAGQVDLVARLLPNSPDLAALRELAAMGAPSRPALASAFPATAARIAVAARQPGEHAGFLARASYFLSGFMTVRRTDRLTGPGADAVLARAERAVGAGELETALRELSTLGPNARAAAGPWRADAERRLAIERRLAALRTAVAAGVPGAGG